MNLKEQRYVCTLADTKSLAQAAKQLYISQSTLSTFISTLEKNLGAPMFDRNGKKFILTYFGETYVRYARRMLEQEERYQEEINSIRLNYKERIRIGMQNTRSSFISPSLIKAVNEKYPHIDILLEENSSAAMEEELLAGQLDLVFSVCPSAKKELRYAPLFSDELVFIVNKNNPLVPYYVSTDESGENWIDLKILNEGQLLMQNQSQAMYFYSQQILRKYGIAPKKTKTIRRILTIIGLVNEGYGTGFSYTSYLGYAKDISNVLVCKVCDPPVGIDFNAAYRKDSRQEKLIEDIIEIFKGLDI